MANDEEPSNCGGSRYDIRDYGAKGDGIFNDTPAIQSCVNLCE